ncbi:slc22a6-a [Symbiodinium pilosum]|uniref:Slc22a6-a protein n=1 Tax=Symbiodinium pilosum TaxID=2952 RepID=A0A812QHR2_SYMPI|nr:slc22a6-a [Symbiodinium pilosum]
MVALFCSGVMLADGAEMLLVSAIVAAVGSSPELRMGRMARGLLVSSSFAGMQMGNLLSGPLSSRYGRRRICIVSLWLVSIFGLASSMVQTIGQLFFVQISLGCAIGIGGPSAVTLLTEATPTEQRGALSNATGFAFVLGEAWTALGLLLFMPDLKGPWRLLCIWGVLPAFFVSPLGWLVRESPSWLQLSGKRKELNDLLANIQRLHGKGEVNIEVQKTSGCSSKTLASTWHAIIQEGHCRTLVLASYLAFLMNYLFYGTTFAFTQIFSESEGDWTSPAMEMLIVSGAEFAGILIAWLLLLHPTLGRIRALQMLCLGSALSSAALMSVVYGNFYVADPAAYVLKAVVSIMFTFLYLYISEALPVSVRASGVGLCMGIGRLGSIAAPRRHMAWVA